MVRIYKPAGPSENKAASPAKEDKKPKGNDGDKTGK